MVHSLGIVVDDSWDNSHGMELENLKIGGDSDEPDNDEPDVPEDMDKPVFETTIFINSDRNISDKVLALFRNYIDIQFKNLI